MQHSTRRQTRDVLHLRPDPLSLIGDAVPDPRAPATFQGAVLTHWPDRDRRPVVQPPARVEGEHFSFAAPAQPDGTVWYYNADASRRDDSRRLPQLTPAVGLTGPRIHFVSSQHFGDFDVHGGRRSFAGLVTSADLPPGASAIRCLELRGGVNRVFYRREHALAHVPSRPVLVHDVVGGAERDEGVVGNPGGSDDHGQKEDHPEADDDTSSLGIGHLTGVERLPDPRAGIGFRPAVECSGHDAMNDRSATAPAPPRRFGTDPGVRYLDLAWAIDLRDPSPSFDGDHLTPAGNTRITERLIEPARELLVAASRR